jgi:DNA-binding NarL/FixJ family response regulator
VNNHNIRNYYLRSGLNTSLIQEFSHHINEAEFMPTESHAPLRIAIVEDDPFLGPFLQKVIERAPGMELVRLCRDGEEAIEVLPLAEPDVVLVDLGLPKVKGARLVRALRSRMPHTPLVVLTGNLETASLLSALRGGANGYLIKPSSPAEIVSSIRAAAAHQHPINSSAARLVRGSRGENPTPWREWSRREMEVLDLISEGLSNDDIALRLTLSIETVRSHLKRVYRKLGVRCRTEAAVMYLADEQLAA